MGQNRIVYSPMLCVILLGSLASPAWSAPITFNTALPVAKGEYLFREQLIVNQSGDDPSPLDRDRTVKAAVSVLGYGVNGDLAVFGVLPYQDKQLKLTTTGGSRANRSVSGFGDATVFARYTIYKQNKPGQNFRIAPFAGLKLPTGKDNDRDSLGKLPASVQLGSGSWDPLIGVVTTYQTLNYQLDGQISYQAKNEANNFEAGDVTRLDGSLQYRLWPKTLTGGTPGFLYGIIEANWINQQKNRINGIVDNNSNGSRLFLSPGIQYVTRRWITEAAIQIPVSQDLNGLALENNYIGRLSVRANF